MALLFCLGFFFLFSFCIQVFPFIYVYFNKAPSYVTHWNYFHLHLSIISLKTFLPWCSLFSNQYGGNGSQVSGAGLFSSHRHWSDCGFTSIRFWKPTLQTYRTFPRLCRFWCFLLRGSDASHVVKKYPALSFLLQNNWRSHDTFTPSVCIVRMYFKASVTKSSEQSIFKQLWKIQHFKEMYYKCILEYSGILGILIDNLMWFLLNEKLQVWCFQ